MRGLSLSLLCCLLVLSCSKDSPSPTAPPANAVAEEAGPWQTVSINGALYRRVAAKPTETSQADLLITIPIRITTSDDGSFRFADTVVIAGRTYTADCGTGGGPSGGDDVGNTRATATRLTVPEPTSTTNYEFWFSRDDEYAITSGDEDYFRLYAPGRMWLGVLSRGSTDVKGWLYDQNGRVIHEDDNGRNDGINFIVLGLVDSGTYYVRVTGARTSTSGSYALSVGTRLPDGAGKPVVQAEVERIKADLLATRP